MRQIQFSRRFVVPSLALALILGLALGAVGALAGRALFTSRTDSIAASVVQAAPTSVAQGQLAHAVYLNVWRAGVQTLTTTYDAQHASAMVTITMEGSVPNEPLKVSAAQELTKALCLMAMQALWTSGVALNQTRVLVQGPAQDIYGDIIIQPYGDTKLAASTAQRIAWDTVTADEAWSLYNFAFVQSDFVLNDMG